MPDILERIVADRRTDLEGMGPCLGSAVPSRRARAVVPFLSAPGAILEIKRASPSKGDIAPDLDPSDTASAYIDAGARNVSVLTERRYFRGSLDDLVAASTGRTDAAFLRKDFLLTEDDIDVSYRAGADAVLLISRILETGRLRRMAAACRELGMTPFVEVREADDYAKLAAVAADGYVLSGVNARDLSTFSVDPLVPAAVLSRLPGPAVYESGVESPGAAAYARRLGFTGVLVGEAAARNPAGAAAVVAAFGSAAPDAAGTFWRLVAERRAALRPGRPLVKICGLARRGDAIAAAGLGADILGFVFADSPRAADANLVRALRTELGAYRGATGSTPLLVGVITELDSPRAAAAMELARSGALDAIQWHGEPTSDAVAALDESLSGLAGRYAAVRAGCQADLNAIDRLRRSGEARVLVDARVDGVAGGTGVPLSAPLARQLAARGGLWLAGGLGVGTVGPAMKAYAPELVDASSRLESGKGKKDLGLLSAYFREIEDHATNPSLSTKASWAPRTSY